MVYIRRSVPRRFALTALLSLLMAYSDRHFFAKKFQYIVQAEALRLAASKMPGRQPSESASASGGPTFAWRATSLLRRRPGLSPVAEAYGSQDGSSTPQKTEVQPKKLGTDVIRRMDVPLKRINPSGWISEGIPAPLRRLSSKLGSGGGQDKGQMAEQPSSSIPVESPIHSANENSQGSSNAYVARMSCIKYTGSTFDSIFTPEIGQPSTCQVACLLINHRLTHVSCSWTWFAHSPHEQCTSIASNRGWDTSRDYH